MPPARPIVFLSDFGLGNEWVGLCHAVMTGIAPQCPIVDLSHLVRPLEVVSGAILLALLVGWGFARLPLVTRPDARTLLGALAVATLAIGASVDYVLHFPAIPVVGAALIGAAQSDPIPVRDEPIGSGPMETS